MEEWSRNAIASAQKVIEGFEHEIKSVDEEIAPLLDKRRVLEEEARIMVSHVASLGSLGVDRSSVRRGRREFTEQPPAKIQRFDREESVGPGGGGDTNTDSDSDDKTVPLADPRDLGGDEVEAPMVKVAPEYAWNNLRSVIEVILVKEAPQTGAWTKGRGESSAYQHRIERVWYVAVRGQHFPEPKTVMFLFDGSDGTFEVPNEAVKEAACVSHRKWSLTFGLDDTWPYTNAVSKNSVCWKSIRDELASVESSRMVRWLEERA